MASDVTDWVAEKLKANGDLEIADRTPEAFLAVRRKDGYTFLVAVLGIKTKIELSDVEPLFAGETTPQLVVNIPSKAIWSGPAIDRIHAATAAFGTFGDISKAADTGDAGSYRDKNMAFFINAIKQHRNVSSVSYVYDSVFKADLRSGQSVVVTVVDAYNMSAEDVRNARDRVGHFDAVVKSTSYGSITSPAHEAAGSMGAHAMTFRELMGWLAK